MKSRHRLKPWMRHLEFVLKTEPTMRCREAMANLRNRVLESLGKTRPGYQRMHVIRPGANQPLEAYLSQVFPNKTRTIREAIEDGRVRVNLRRPGAHHRPRHMDLVEFWIDDLPLFQLVPLDAPPKIVHLDDHVTVLYKPSGALSCPNRVKIREPSLAGSLVQMGLVSPDLGDFISPGLANRLDRKTSGLVAVGRTRRALAGLKRSFRRREVLKEYTAVVWGEMGQGGVVESAIARDRTRRFAFKVHQRGRDARTSFEVIARLPGASVLKVQPHTGRTHQIRVHLASIGHPIVGDGLYGTSARRELDSPMLLHAGRLGFLHPVTGMWVEFSAPVEPQFTARMEDLRKCRKSLRS